MLPLRGARPRDATASLVRGEDVVAAAGDEDGVLELRRQRAVAGDSRPSVPPDAVRLLAHVQDGFDRERLPHLHAPLHRLLTTSTGLFHVSDAQ